MSDIVVFGSFVVDLMARSAHIPVPGETIKSSLFRMGAGGQGKQPGGGLQAFPGGRLRGDQGGQRCFCPGALRPV